MSKWFVAVVGFGRDDTVAVGALYFSKARMKTRLRFHLNKAIAIIKESAHEFVASTGRPKMPYQFGMRTLLLFVAGIAIYITLFKLVWHWTLLATITAIPLVISLVIVRRWTRLTAAERTAFRATAFTAIAFVIWLPWVVLVVLGPGEAIFNVFSELIPWMDIYLRLWHDVWG